MEVGIEHYTGFEESGRCWWCGGEFPDKRHRHYCSEKCSQNYWHHFNWQGAVNFAILNANHKCQFCGKEQSLLNKYSSWNSRVNLEVHHIIEVKGEDRSWNILNVPCNLLVLCHECHLKIHARYRELDGTAAKPTKELLLAKQIKDGQLILNLEG